MSEIKTVWSPPYYEALNNYEWIDDFLVSEQIKRQIAELVVDKKAVRDTMVDKKSLMGRLKESHERYKQRCLQKLATIIMRRHNSKDPFANLEYSLHGGLEGLRRAGLQISWADIEAAMKLVPNESFADAVTDTQREKEISSLEKQIAGLKNKLKEHSPQSYFMISNGNVGCDSREVFVEHWRKIQNSCKAPCGPQGRDLRFSHPEEQSAYDKLKIAKSINHRGQEPNQTPYTCKIKTENF